MVMLQTGSNLVYKGKCSTPDLAFCFEDIHRGIKREVGTQLGGSDHKPVFITVESNVIPIDSPQPRWNYKKAKRSLFSIRANEFTKNIRVQGRNENIVVKEWTRGILKAVADGGAGVYFFFLIAQQVLNQFQLLVTAVFTRQNNKPFWQLFRWWKTFQGDNIDRL